MGQEAACIFCRIVHGNSPASVVYENDHVLALMNLRQANPGHVLVIPKRHVTFVYELDAMLAGEVFRCVSLVAGAVQKLYKPDGITVWQSNGPAAGQEIPHLHMHILPRRMGDKHVSFYPEEPPIADRAQLDALAADIRRYIGE